MSHPAQYDPTTQSIPDHKKKAAPSLRFARFSRKLHKWSGIFLALAAVVISISGGFIAFKTKIDYL